ncbi:DUF2190 family protein [Sphingomonas hankookensis]|uniref:DUF2190 family protein n=1 Tax=Sphingomonas hankookensis TaxID=563996 RepID=UPI00234FB087|nr:DUF2190 family protein [Sphingomonas hankookensis]WCP71558.1 DUF2190 family protein [Sphingomonas hankookensis]
MNNFIQPGKTLDFVAPAGGVVSGQAQLRGTVLHVPGASAKEGETYAGTIEGVFELPCATGTAWETTVTVLYWDAANKRVTPTANGNTKIGFAAAPKLAAAASGNVCLLPLV